MSRLADKLRAAPRPRKAEGGKDGANGQEVHVSAVSSDRDSGTVVGTEPDALEKQSSWRRRLNPLKSREIPRIPSERQPSREQSAGPLSKLLFSWLTPLIHLGYQRPLETNDVWQVNPDRSVVGLEETFDAEFTRRVASGSKRPLLGALYVTFRREFVLGALCQLLATGAQNVSPYLLKYLIAFATEAFDARRDGGRGPSEGYGIGLVFAITGLQVVMTFAINHFLYLGTTVGGEARAVLMSRIFAKSLRLSGRARAGGSTSSSPPSGVEPGSKEEKRWFEKALPKKKGAKGAGAAQAGQQESEGWTNGRIINLLSTDTYRIDQASGMFHMLWSTPLAITITIVLLIINLGYSALPGLGLLFMTAPLLGAASRSLFKRRFAINKLTDKRVSLTSEALQSIRFIKVFGWEQSFLQRVEKIRKKEVRSIQILLAIRDAVQSIGMAIPVFASMLSFITYALTSHVLDPAPIFSSLALFNSLRFPLNFFPLVLGQNIDAYASMKRIQEFLLAEEATEDAEYDTANENAIVIKNATFTWEQTNTQANQDASSSSGSSGSSEKHAEKKPTAALTSTSTTTPTETFQIPNLNLTVGRAELVGVIGSVGAGKSSLLAALAGDMRRTADNTDDGSGSSSQGSVVFGATRAFCPQYAWIQNASVRDNITFGRPFDRARYDAVTAACALRADFAMLPDGDRTEIGERGITVSGGQKQRINVARACYFGADIVLLDDPLSAVDAHVGRHIMDEAICGELLRDKCRVLATHSLHVLHRCDRIVWLEAGRVRAEGTYEELMARDEEFVKLMTLSSHDDKAKKGAEDEDDGESVEGEVDEDQKAVILERMETAKSQVALMQAEERAVKAVSWDVYGGYIRASGSLLVVPLVLILLTLAQASNIATSLWLSWWTAGQFPLSMNGWIGIYAGLGVVQALSAFAFSVSISFFGTRASKVMFKRAMLRVLRAPMSFFDTTPLGRITNRFSKDIDVMDNNLTDSLRMYLMTLGTILATFGLILAYFYLFVAALVPLVVVYLLAAAYYRASAREIKRHEALQRSHVFAKFSEAVYGTSTIRAYGMQAHFVDTLRRSIDDFDGAYFLTFANQRWLGLRLDAIGLAMIFVIGMLVVTSRFSVNPSTGGLVLSYMLSIIAIFNFAVRQMAEVENDMNNTERVHHYGTVLEEEAPLRVGQVPANWPQHGAIKFDQVQLRYRAGLPLVLKGISVDISGGERIGIVGRTGSGKSTIIQALFRMVEISGGSITIDGVNISTIGLADLRSRLAIIPQDPTLFQGTVRSNLDPFGERGDAELAAALRRSGLVDETETETETTTTTANAITLDSAVEEEGLNFSLGQRQLMALARALVKDSRIIVCDEATSSVDFATDERVQRTLESLRDKTFLCIAHRLRTIIGYDRIVVMDQGNVAELGAPLELFDEGGIFRGMCDKSNIKREDILEKVASRG